MPTRILILLTVTLLYLGYRFYGRWLTKRLNIDDATLTPALTRPDGVDFVKARKSMLMGHHFASIAGAAPIVGPILAIGFGWLPVWLWVIFGGIFMGGVHDLTSLVASIRHDGESIGSVIERHMGRSGRLLFLSFSWLALLLVIAVFTLLVARTFTSVPATATSSMGFLLLALFFGVGLNRFKLPLLPLSLVGILLLFLLLPAGMSYPLDLAAWLPGGASEATKVFRLGILAYVFFASVLPVHLLLQPRDYLNSFLLYAMMGMGIAGIMVAAPTMQVPAFVAWEIPGRGHLFPILFVTVACGAISGFHSLVASGTTSKQLAKETDAKPVAYGSMLIESLLAVLALIAVGTATGMGDIQSIKDPIAAFAGGLARLMPAIGLPQESAKVFITLAVSAFALTSLDTATRIGRFVFQELADTIKPNCLASTNRFIATILTICGASLLLFSKAGTTIWPLFGAANQLLATLALLAVAVWLGHQGKRALYVRIPMFIMFIITISALGLLIMTNLEAKHYALALLAAALFLLALVLAWEAWQALYGSPSNRKPSDPGQTKDRKMDTPSRKKESTPSCPC